MARVAAIVIVEDPETYESLCDWVDENGAQFALIDSQRFVAEVADSIPNDQSRTLVVQLPYKGEASLASDVET